MKKKYIVDGKIYEIPDEESGAFLKDFPNAKVSYNVDGTDYEIPHQEADAFETDMGLKKKVGSNVQPTKLDNGLSDTPKADNAAFDNVLHPFKDVKDPSTIKKVPKPVLSKDELAVFSLDKAIKPQTQDKPIPGYTAPKTLIEAHSQDKNISGNLWNSLTTGIGRLGASGADLTIQLLNKVMPSEEGYTDEERLKKLRSDISEPTRTATTELIGANVTPEEKANFDKNLLTSTAGGLVEMIPAIGGKGLGLLLQAYDHGMESINSSEEGKALPENVKTVFSGTVGAVVGAMDRLSLTKIFGKESSKVATGIAIKVLTNLVKTSKSPVTAEIAEKAIMAELKSLKNTVITSGKKVLESAAIEGGTETAQEGVTMLAETILNKSQDKEVFEEKSFGENLERLATAGMQGVIGGGILGGIAAPFSSSNNYISDKLANAKGEEDLVAIKEELLDAAEKNKMTKTELSNLSDTIDNYIRINQKVSADVPNRKEIVEKIVEGEDIQSEIEKKEAELENADEETVPEIRTDIEALNKRAEEIKNEILQPEQNQQEPGTEVAEPKPTPSEVLPSVKSEEVKSKSDKLIDIIPLDGEKDIITEKIYKDDKDLNNAYEYQDKNAEPLINKSGNHKGFEFKWDNNEWRYRFENAGDVIRELTKFKNKQIDASYIYEKINALESFLKRNPNFNETFADKNIIEKLKSEYEGQPTFSEAQKQAKKLILDLLNGNIKEAKSQIEYFDQFREGDTSENLKKANAYNQQSETKPIQNEQVQNTEVPITETPGSTTNEAVDSNIGTSKETTGEGGGIKEPPVVEEGNGIYVEPKRTVLSHRGLQEVATEFGLEDVVPRDRKSDAKLQKDVENTTNDWKEKGEYEKNVTGLIEKAEKGEPLSDEQRLLLQQHLSNVREKTAKVKSEFGINSTEYDTQLKELSRLKEAGQKARSAAGAALRIPNIASIPDNSLEGWMTEKMESSGTDKLTDAQKAEVEKQHSDYEAKLKKADELLVKANEEIARLKAEAELLVTKKEVRKKDKATLKVEREGIVSSIKDKWKNAGKETLSVSIPYAQQLIAIAPDVARLTRNLVDTGVIKLADVIDNIHDVLKDVSTDITKEDVRDLIAGVYNEKKPTKSALESQVRDLRDEAKLIKKFEDLTNGKKVSENKQVQRNQEITELKKKIKDFKTNNPDLEGQLKTIKKRNEAETKKVEEKIKNKEFETKKTIPFDENAALKKANPKLYKEAMDAIVAKDEARQKFDLAKRKDELDKRSKLRKAFDFGAKLISTSKAIKAGIDDSVTFVQLGMAVMANPKSGLKAKIEAIKDINNNRFKRELAALHNSPDWPTIKNSELDITEPKSLTKENIEELYSGNLLDQPIYKGMNLWTYTGGIFERMFTSMGNNMRLNMFRKRIEYLENQGKTFDTHPQEYKDAARVINELTGRGKMNAHAAAAMPIISPVIWAPKMLSSTMNLLGISDLFAGATGGKVGTKGLYKELTPSQRTYAFTQMGKGIGMGLAVMGALYMNGWEVDLDPQSSTFGTVKHGTTSYNVFGRYAGFAKTLIQIATGTKKTTLKEIDLDEEGKTSGVFGKFVRGKMTPFAGVAWDYKMNAKKNMFTGEPINLETLPNDLLTPISIGDVKKGIEQDGSLALLTRWLPAVEGIQVTDDRDFKNKLLFTKEEIDSDEFKPLKDKGIDLPGMGTPKQHKIDVDEKHPNQAKEDDKPYGLMTDEEFKQFNDTKKKYLVKEINYILNKEYPKTEIKQSGMDKKVATVLGKDLPKDVLKDKIEAATKDITKRIMEQMFPTPKDKIKIEYKSEEEREKEKIVLEEQLEKN